MKKLNRKKLIALLAVLLVLAVAVGGTIAFLATQTTPLVNTFTPAEVTVYITDNVNNGVKEDVVITNTGNTNAYIRARIVGNWVDDNGIVVQGWTFTESDFSGLPGDGWVRNGDYYYYTNPVAPGGTTSGLFTSYTAPASPVEGAHLVMDILVQAVQSEGVTSDGEKAVVDAWGVDPSEL